ncbi:hypothetical protein Sjap_000897 [Stephania japonica]|uniref:non-specific serine/threonine protein kinase n=1 Tax=Stephania japonica TaxID=461633 RepID=A0AAP0KIZ2_9MAGN
MAKLDCCGYVETDPTGRYGRFKDVLGKGAMKVVYRAFDEVLGMEVAWNQVKLNDVFRSPEELQRLYSEVHLLRTLSHDAIMRFYTSWIDVNRRTFNFITEMFTSGTLREFRKRYKRVDIRAVKSWARQILSGLVCLHGQDPPVIHRDLKCDNIFVNGHLGQVKIGDLGLAGILRGSQAHSVIGTPEFMAPELYEEKYNELVDVYSFGMCVLEMLTSEYPYTECSNPAQIYKKVTSGKLPDAFYRIHDLEARDFVGKCLEPASKRPSARQLMLDPFLAFDEEVLMLDSRINKHNQNHNESTLYLPSSPIRSTNMKITGKMNPEDDTIFLKVQIADKDGCVRNIHFPFDVTSDTPIDVATEMVKELEISDKEPDEIAQVIEKEISSLVPQWREWDHSNEHNLQHSFNYADDDDENEDHGEVHVHHPFYSFSSCSSSQASLSGLLTSSNREVFQEENEYNDHDWPPDDFLIDDDTGSQSSFNSCNYSNINYSSGPECDFDVNSVEKECHHLISNNKKVMTTRFCPEEKTRTNYHHHHHHHHLNVKCQDQHKAFINGEGSSSMTYGRSENWQLGRMRSLLDIRSQLLHRSLMEEIHKRRLFKTVGAVENIGYVAPPSFTRKDPQPIARTWRTAQMLVGPADRSHPGGTGLGDTRKVVKVVSSLNVSRSVEARFSRDEESASPRVNGYHLNRAS